MWMLSILFLQIFQISNVIVPERVRKGMRGFGLSIYEGSSIDTFNVEILGKLPESETGHTVILARLEGNVVDEAGILNGMSGSPVYINGDLLGAVAFAWGFSKEPICGITPFREMKAGGKGGMPRSSSGLKSIGPSLNVSGFPSASFNFLDSIGGFVQNSQINTVGQSDSSGNFVPGGLCGIALVSGDGNISITGTITEVRGDTVYAFGHQAYGLGKSELPLVGGYATGYLPSLYRSFKFIVPGRIEGTITFDGPSGIIGRLGKEPPLVNCRIKAGDNIREYRVTAQKELFPNLFSYLIFANLVDYGGVSKPYTVSGHLNLWAEESEFRLPIILSGNTAFSDIYRFTRDYIQTIEDNRFRNIEFDSSSINLTISPEIRRYRIEELRLKNEKYRAGEKINAEVRLSRYRNTDTLISFSLDAPQDSSELLLMVSGSSEFLQYERNRVPLNYKFGSYGEWYKFLNSLPQQNELILSIYEKGFSLGTGRGELKNLPPTVRGFYEKNKNERTFSNLFLLEKKRIGLNGPVSGKIMDAVKVGR